MGNKEYNLLNMKWYKRIPLLLLFFLTVFSFSISARSYRTSPSDVHVNGYYRKNGTYVQPYYRTPPNNTKLDNYGCIDSGICGDSTAQPYYYVAPTPVTIPSTLNGTPTYLYNDSSNTYDVAFNWDDWDQSSGWSISISQYPGADPGPNMDTTSSIWTFKNIYPGKKYINMKADVGGSWSGVSYWTIDVPPFPTITPTPIKTPTLQPTEIINPNNINTSNHNKSFWQWLFGN